MCARASLLSAAAPAVLLASGRPARAAAAAAALAASSACCPPAFAVVSAMQLAFFACLRLRLCHHLAACGAMVPCSAYFCCVARHRPDVLCDLCNLLASAWPGCCCVLLCSGFMLCCGGLCCCCIIVFLPGLHWLLRNFADLGFPCSRLACLQAHRWPTSTPTSTPLERQRCFRCLLEAQCRVHWRSTS